MEKQEILDRTGNENWDDIVRWLSGYTITEMVEEFSRIWPLEEDNQDLANAICRYL
jgi:hypothetical protein